MKASEAKKLSDQHRVCKFKNELDEVYKTINTHIKKGEYSCTFYKHLSAGALNELKKDGYLVTSNWDPRDGKGFCTINWE